jgi:hypothetical protein
VLLGVGVIVGLPGLLNTLSLELLLGEILAGKLRVFVHWTKLRTIFGTLTYYHKLTRPHYAHQRAELF